MQLFGLEFFIYLLSHIPTSIKLIKQQKILEDGPQCYVLCYNTYNESMWKKKEKIIGNTWCDEFHQIR